MDRVIIKKSDNINLIYPEMPDQDLKPDEISLKDKFKRKKRRFRPEPGGIHEQMSDGMSDERNQFRGPGTDNSYTGGETGEAVGF